jgi:hypothetical protein
MALSWITREKKIVMRRRFNIIKPCLYYLACLAMASFSTASSADTPKPFVATYQANYSGIKVTATRSLKLLDTQLMELRFEARSWLANIQEYSQFNWRNDINKNSTGNNHLTPQHYNYQRKGLGKDRHANLTFDWPNKKVTNDVQGKRWSMALPELAMDKLGYQLQLRHDLINQQPLTAYKIADGGRLKTYKFERISNEVLNTPLGKINTTKIRRVREDSERTTQIWFANDWDYLIVKLQQTEKDGKQYEINLINASIDNQIVTGLEL